MNTLQAKESQSEYLNLIVSIFGAVFFLVSYNHQRILSFKELVNSLVVVYLRIRLNNGF